MDDAIASAATATAPGSGSDHPKTDDVCGLAVPPPSYQVHAVIAHKGTSVHCGHYVAYVYDREHGSGGGSGSSGNGRWILFNDEKVAHQEDGLHGSGIQQGYLYVLQSRSQ